jgi:transglutaminase-like putative cysteine protease
MQRWQRREYGWTAALVASAVLGFPLSGAARDEPVLHERYETNATEDAQLQATTLDGTLPAALATHSGAVALNDLRNNAGTPPAYQSEASDYSQEYRADADTRRPELVGYSDPVIPTIPPYKRSYAYDTVGEQFELLVAAPTLRALAVGGAPRLEDDQFFADLQVELPRDVAVRVPNVGPATRVIVAQASPVQDFALFRDGADNWFVQSTNPGVVQLTLHLAIDRRSFGGEFPRISWATLRPHANQLPQQVQQAGRAVASEIGVGEQAPAAAVQRLVEYFRSFAPSEAPLESNENVGGEALYRELALSRRGVCRHRAYAFTVTALSLGIPTRFVRNEAHAWVEVFDGELWHRIDLGGAAGRAVFDLGDRPVHVEPRDPYPWPERSTSAHEMTERALRERSTAGSPSSPPAQNMTSSETEAGRDYAAKQEPDVPASTLMVNVGRARITRGERLALSGSVSAASAVCDRVRVDLWLVRGAQRHALGTLMTDAGGHFSGNMVVPFSVPIGDYDIEAVTPGRSPLCGPGHTQR